MTERFTDRLYRLAQPVWEAQHSHPFVRGIGDGTLEVEKFKFWVRQDYLFLIDYARLLALAVARASDLATMRRFADLVHATLSVEMELHRSYAAEFGISLDELEAEEKAPTTRGYTDFLLRVATVGDFSELIAALLPCLWGFCDIGQRLARGPRPTDERYAKWIDLYASAEFAELADWCRELVDQTAAGLPEEALRHMEEVFSPPAATSTGSGRWPGAWSGGRRKAAHSRLAPRGERTRNTPSVHRPCLELREHRLT